MTPGADPGLDLGSLRGARSRIRDAVRHTPLQHSSWLSAVAGVPIYLKLECWQRTRSFKFRGAYHALATLDRDRLAGGLVTASAGNHGLALSLAASLNDATATIFVPTATPRTKKDRIRRMGGDLREVPGIYDDAAAAARAFAEREGAHFLSAFADPAVVLGQGTVGLEIEEDLPGVREVVVPVGGGGLIAGVGAAFEAGGGGVRVIGVQSTATTAMHAAFEAGRVVPVDDPVETLCEGLAGETEQVAYERARVVTDALRLVDEAEIAPAIRALYHNEAVVAEGSGVVPVAAVLAGDLHLEGPAALVVSGGNIDMGTLARIFASD